MGCLKDMFLLRLAQLYWITYYLFISRIIDGITSKRATVLLTSSPYNRAQIEPSYWSKKPKNCYNNHQRCIDPGVHVWQRSLLELPQRAATLSGLTTVLRGKQKRVEGVKQVKLVGTRVTKLERFLQYQCFTYMYDLIYHHWSLTDKKLNYKTPLRMCLTMLGFLFCSLSPFPLLLF